MKRLFIIIIFIIAELSVWAYPIKPLTLRRLIIYSEFIVFATVDNPFQASNTNMFYDESIGDSIQVLSNNINEDGLADLIIQEILKGEISSQIITVEYPALLICPKPPSYPDKKTVITFLNKKDTSSIYNTSGLSYGSKIMDNEVELNEYKTRVIEFLNILKISSHRKRKKATIEWLVKCAEKESTRWEGSYELSRNAKFMLDYDESEYEDFQKHLTQIQKDRLAVALFLTDTIRLGELYLARVIDKKMHYRLRTYLINNLMRTNYYLVEDVMSMIIRIEPNNELNRVFENLKAISYGESERGIKQKQLIIEFMEIAKMNK